VLIAGGGSQWNIANNLYVGGSSTAAGGTGSLVVDSGGTLSIGGTLKIWNTGSVTINTGGTLRASTLDVAGSTLVNNGTIHSTVNVAAGASFHGNGTVDTLVANGTVSPGNSPGTMTSSSTTWGSSGTYVWQINELGADQAAGKNGTAGGNPGWDLWHTGNLSVDPGFVIEVHSITIGDADSALDEFNDAQYYKWLIATSNGNFDPTTVGYLNSYLNANAMASSNGTFPSFFDVFATIDMNELWLEYTPVPEPGTLLLAGVAAVSMSWRLRRRRIASR
jgi:hypothetical protein